MSVISGYGGNIYIPSGNSIAVTWEVTNGDAARQRYIIANRARRAIDKTQPVVVRVSTDGGATWSVASPSTYTFSYFSGAVMFASPQPSGAIVKIDCSYIPMTAYAQCTSWQLSIDIASADITTFSSAWKLQQPTILSASAKISRLWDYGDFVTYRAGAIDFVRLFIDEANWKGYAFYGIWKSEDVKADVKDVIQDDRAFEVTGPVEYFYE